MQVIPQKNNVFQLIWNPYPHMYVNVSICINYTCINMCTYKKDYKEIRQNVFMMVIIISGQNGIIGTFIFIFILFFFISQILYNDYFSFIIQVLSLQQDQRCEGCYTKKQVFKGRGLPLLPFITDCKIGWTLSEWDRSK